MRKKLWLLLLPLLLVAALWSISAPSAQAQGDVNVETTTGTPTATATPTATKLSTVVMVDTPTGTPTFPTSSTALPSATPTFTPTPCVGSVPVVMFKDLNNDEHLGIGEEPEPGSVYIDHSFTPHWTGTGMIVIDILCGEHRLDAVNDDGDWWGWVTTTIASEVGPDLVELPLYPKVAGQIWHDLDGDYQNDPGEGVEKATVSLLTGDGLLAYQTTSEEGGWYRFRTNILTGTYIMKAVWFNELGVRLIEVVEDNVPAWDLEIRVEFLPPPTPTITPTPTRTPTRTPDPACVDQYEPNSVRVDAKPLPLGVDQHHMFSDPADVDMIRIDGVVGQTIKIETSNLATGVDTFMFLYDENSWRVGQSDDLDSTRCVAGETAYCASSISWRAAYSGSYYAWLVNLGSGEGRALVREFLGEDAYQAEIAPKLAKLKVQAASRCASYDISARQMAVWLPLISRSFTRHEIKATDTPTPTGTPTPMATPALATVVLTRVTDEVTPIPTEATAP